MKTTSKQLYFPHFHEYIADFLFNLVKSFILLTGFCTFAYNCYYQCNYDYN